MLGTHYPGMWIISKNSGVLKHTYRVIQNDCQGFNNLSYTIHLRKEYMYFFI